MSKPTRAVRNRNPMNLEKGDDWQGLSLVQPDVRFCSFTKPKYGYRAAAIILARYASRGVNTVRETIEHWAPATENNVAAYVATVCRKLGIGPDDIVDLTSANFVPKLMLAMTDVEAGKGHPFSLAEAAEGFAMAVGRS